MQLLNTNLPNFRKIELSNSFLKDFKNQLVILLTILLFVEMIMWAINPEHHTEFSSFKNLFSYVRNVVIGFFAPEICTLFILNLLIQYYIKLLNVKFINSNAKNIVRYELAFIPLFCVAFFLFFPITLHIRFILREIPNFTVERYIKYLQEGLSWNMYFTYLPFTFVLGYVIINVSLVKDFLSSSSSSTIEENSSVPVATDGKAEEIRVERKSHLSVIECKNGNGTTFLKVEGAYFFDVEDEQCYIEHLKGRYRVSQKLNILEAGLDPTLFFRISRKHIINLNYLKTYTYWEKGKYNLLMDTPVQSTLTMPRARFNALKEAIERNVFEKQ